MYTKFFYVERRTPERPETVHVFEIRFNDIEEEEPDGRLTMQLRYNLHYRYSVTGDGETVMRLAEDKQIQFARYVTENCAGEILRTISHEWPN